MEAAIRKPLQGVTNIIRFNWHYYILALVLIALLGTLQLLIPSLQTIALIVIGLILISTTISLITSAYIYDFSSLYRLHWLTELSVKTNSKIININAGFDETSFLLQEKYPNAFLEAFDFYDETKHTEISIARARKLLSVFPNTKQISTSSIPIPNQSVDYVFVILAAHEIRVMTERQEFFKELNRILKPDGQIIVTEHLRDLPNFFAYNVGFFHFFSKVGWKQTFSSAQLHLEKEIKITPFISAFILNKNGIAS